MKAILLLSQKPYFSFYLPLLRMALAKYMESPSVQILKTLVDNLNGLSKSKALTMQLWGTSFSVDMPMLQPDHFSGASLLELVVRFREDSMLLWLGMLMQHRILFSGQVIRNAQERRAARVGWARVRVLGRMRVCACGYSIPGKLVVCVGR